MASTSEVSVPRSNKKKRTNNWSRAKTLCFLSSCKENEIVKKMDGKRFRWLDVMTLVKTDMAASEYRFVRDEETLVTKFKTLK